jgi:hypothetical protein
MERFRPSDLKLIAEKLAEHVRETSDLDRFVSAETLAARTGLSVRLIHKMKAQGLLTHMKIGTPGTKAPVLYHLKTSMDEIRRRFEIKAKA